MEWKKFGRGSRTGSLVASAMECKKVGSILMSSRTTMFASGFAFAFLLCSVLLAFNYPSKMVINPILIQRQTWFHSMFRRSSNSSAFFSFIFSNSESASANLEHETFPSPKNESSNVIKKMPDQDKPKPLTVDEKKSKSRKKGKSRKRGRTPESNQNTTADNGLIRKNNTEGTLILGPDQKNTNVTKSLNSTNANANADVGQNSTASMLVSMNGSESGSGTQRAPESISSAVNMATNGTEDDSGTHRAPEHISSVRNMAMNGTEPDSDTRRAPEAISSVPDISINGTETYSGTHRAPEPISSVPNMAMNGTETDSVTHKAPEVISSVPNKVMNKTETGSGTSEALEPIPSLPKKEGESNNTDVSSVASNMKELKPEEASSEQNGTRSVSTEEKHCNIFYGRWVHDDSYPYYPAGTCPHLDEAFNCFRNKRPDKDYEKWRWQPNDCDIHRLNATDMLERLRGKRLVFVGDSLNRNMWESLVCILRHSVRDKRRVHEISGRQEFRTEGFYAFRYEDYNCSVEFVRAPFLVQEWEMPADNGTMKETLRLDVMESCAPKYKESDIIIFNTGHWWSHEKTSQGKDYYQEGDHVYPELNVLEAFRKALRTWGRWVDENIDPNRTQVFFRGYSASHFSGGQWNSGGQCHTETQPIFNESYLIKYPPKMEVLESVIKEIKTPIIYLNITRITDYRKDGHPSVYRKQYLSQVERMAPEKYQDCSHWCLPGIPDTWNELLYALLLKTKKGVWAK
eukprot:Gb_12396 [translate_table: standard]